MGRNLALKTRHEMPEIAGAVALDLKALAKLAYDRFHQTARTGGPACETARMAVFHITAQWRGQVDALACQILLENRADKDFVAQACALDGGQVHVNERIALAHVSGKQGNVLRITPPRRWSAAWP